MPEDFIAVRLGKAEVCIKYGLMGDPIENLEAIVERYPDELETWKRLRDLYADQRDETRAAEANRRIAELETGAGR